MTVHKLFQYSVVSCLLSFFVTQAQEIKILKTSDFNLKGPVKHCLEKTKYGKESYFFNEHGVLYKSITQYNKRDYDITLFKFKGDTLREKRYEVYRDKKLDKVSSTAHFYEYLPENDIKELVVNYAADLVSRNHHNYNDNHQLTAIAINNPNGLDTWELTYEEIADAHIRTNYYFNKILTKTKEVKTELDQNRVKFTQINYTDGVPLTVNIQVEEGGKCTIKEEKEVVNWEDQKFKNEVKQVYQYDKDGHINNIVVKKSNSTTQKQLIHFVDASPYKNWIKKIDRSTNNYWSRTITYFQEENPSNK